MAHNYTIWHKPKQGPSLNKAQIQDPKKILYYFVQNTSPKETYSTIFKQC